MVRTLVAYGLMVLLIAGGLGLGLYLRRDSRERWARRRLASLDEARPARVPAESGILRQLSDTSHVFAAPHPERISPCTHP